MASLSRAGRGPPTPHHAGGPGGLRVRNTPRPQPAGGAQSRLGEVLRLPAASVRRPPGFTSSRSPRRPGGPGSQRSAAPGRRHALASACGASARPPTPAHGLGRRRSL